MSLIPPRGKKNNEGKNTKTHRADAQAATQAATLAGERGCYPAMTTTVARYQLPHGALCVSKGNLVAFDGCAIVNAADTKCLYGKGVDGAVNKAGGPALIEARKQLPVRAGTRDVRCPVGDAVVTVGGNLRCRHVIHAVGPNFNPKAQWVQKVAPDGEEKLHSAYLSAMHRAKEHGVRTLAFSLLSAGFFRGVRARAQPSPHPSASALCRASRPADCPAALLRRAALLARTHARAAPTPRPPPL
jgi:O-acetyl-ADP-ribose deacetylase (regulator of RNase III)